MQYQHVKNKVYLINYHLIWCPKRRKKILIGEHLNVYNLILYIAVEIKGFIISPIPSTAQSLSVSYQPLGSDFGFEGSEQSVRKVFPKGIRFLNGGKYVDGHYT
jgi:hypothetical protein